MTRVRLPHGEGWAWPATRYEDVKAVTHNVGQMLYVLLARTRDDRPEARVALLDELLR